MNHHRLALAATIILLAGCGASVGGGGDGSLAGSLDTATAPYAVLDLSARTFVWRAELPDLASNPAYRGQSLVFHRVQVGGTDVMVAVFELTQAQWQTIDGTQPWTQVVDTLAPTPAAAQAACNLDYDTIVASLAAFPLADGARLDLPTAAEWTAACGTSSGWSWGSSASLSQLRAATVVYETADGIPGPRSVGARSANPAGFYDMHGNVWEWNKPGDQVRGGSWADSYWLSRAETAPGTSQGLDTSIPHGLIGARLVLRP